MYHVWHTRARQVVLRTVAHGTSRSLPHNSIRLSNRILSPPGSVHPLSQVALSDTMDNWVARPHTLLTVAQALQLQSTRRVQPAYYRVPSSLFVQDEDAHIKGTQVATENLFQDFPGLFPAVAGFPLRFLVSETSHTSVDLTSCTILSSFIHPHTRVYMFWLSDRSPRGEGYCDTSVRTDVSLRLFHTWLRSFTTHVFPRFPVSTLCGSQRLFVLMCIYL